MINLSSVEEIIDLYEVFVFDLCGVVHDGEKLYAGVDNLLSQLRSAGKHVAFISNSSRPASKVHTLLEDMGLHISENDRVVTSFEVFKHYAENKKHDLYNSKIFQIGENKNLYKLAKLQFTQNPIEANYIIISLIKDANGEDHDKESRKSLFANLVSQGCKGICINPDITAPHANSFRHTPGYFAREYEEMGGKVSYYGKPYQHIYEFALNKYIEEMNISKNKMIAFGDSIATDIKGANKFGIDSVLVYAHGMHKSVDFHNTADTKKMIESYENYQPKYVIDIIK